MTSEREYPPDYVSAATLAHRLDCSETTVHAYVRDGLLPQSIHIGHLVRWRWSDVERRIATLETGAEQSHADDPYLSGIERVATKETGH